MAHLPFEEFDCLLWQTISLFPRPTPLSVLRIAVDNDTGSGRVIHGSGRVPLFRFHVLAKQRAENRVGLGQLSHVTFPKTLPLELHEAM